MRSLAPTVTEAIVDLALSCGGTSTGEHGIGIGKKAQLAKERGEAVDVMRALKRGSAQHHESGKDIRLYRTRVFVPVKSRFQEMT
jgi:hypothetical protein